jgi:hypothetical protein
MYTLLKDHSTLTSAHPGHADSHVLSMSIGGSSGGGQTRALGDRSPLHFASERGAVAVMEQLIAAGAKVCFMGVGVFGGRAYECGAAHNQVLEGSQGAARVLSGCAVHVPLPSVC